MQWRSDRWVWGATGRLVCKIMRFRFLQPKIYFRLQSCYFEAIFFLDLFDVIVEDLLCLLSLAEVVSDLVDDSSFRGVHGLVAFSQRH